MENTLSARQRAQYNHLHITPNASSEPTVHDARAMASHDGEMVAVVSSGASGIVRSLCWCLEAACFADGLAS